jgi:hypothetical protein
MSTHRKKGRLPPFVPLIRTTLASPAWKQLSFGARCLYVVLHRARGARAGHRLSGGARGHDRATALLDGTERRIRRRDPRTRPRRNPILYPHTCVTWPEISQRVQGPATPKKRTLPPDIVPDGKWPGMYRLRLPNGRLSDMVNLTRAKDAANAAGGAP